MPKQPPPNVSIKSNFGSTLEREFFVAWLKYGRGLPLPECQCHNIQPWLRYLEEIRKIEKPKSRKWKADFAWPDRKIVLEIQGGIYSGGRHTRPAGYQTDLQKALLLQSDGWIFLALTGEMLTNRQGFWVRLVAKTVRDRRFN